MNVNDVGSGAIWPVRTRRAEVVLVNSERRAGATWVTHHLMTFDDTPERVAHDIVEDTFRLADDDAALAPHVFPAFIDAYVSILKLVLDSDVARDLRPADLWFEDALRPELRTTREFADVLLDAQHFGQRLSLRPPFEPRQRTVRLDSDHFGLPQRIAKGTQRLKLAWSNPDDDVRLTILDRAGDILTEEDMSGFPGEPYALQLDDRCDAFSVTSGSMNGAVLATFLFDALVLV